MSQVNAYDSQNYSTSNRVTGTSGSTSVTTTSKKNNSNLDSSDFLQLMVAEMKNQDFMNPTDNTEYISQMSQFTATQAVQELTENSKTSYAASLVGKEVTASSSTSSGTTDTTTGIVRKVSLINNEYVVYVGDNGKTYSLDQINSVQQALSKGECEVATTSLQPLCQNVKTTSANVRWALSTFDTSIQKNLSYDVYYSKDGPLDTKDKVKAATKVTGGSLKGITDESKLNVDLTGLDPNTTYYVNVLVTDENGNQNIYKSQSFTTKRA
ncbi:MULTISPECIES: flagellar hook capping FlgD N-terminal domain-containing protein [Caproicibacterium]|uniref:Basal-body rod modification protein FlgD n=1 Tax=Caproicibacterium argilliputei TaxID=3030016 RepID=A0AA97D7V2_9FIRM|nr:flagellar hook capping FlgD N-terminal domain-containing protein [Caproicibacterium argilliputei]WOC31269.1 flagellar hook capping FlgD N-terminal domain-containing protein [Caproicibacterium argilliputei]